MTKDELFTKYINDSGLTDYYKSELGLKARLFHDLGMYGDIAESCIETLRDSYNVDTSNFQFDKYFPQEFVGDSLFEKAVLSFIPFPSSKRMSKEKFKPLTFEMLRESLITGKLNG